MSDKESRMNPITDDTFTEKISLWLDNELNPAEVTELQAHLAQCAFCRQTYQAMQQLDQMLRGASALMAAPAPGFTARFEVRLAYSHPGARKQMWLGFTVLLIGVLSILSVVGIIAGVILLNLSATLDIGLLYRGLAEFIESINMLGTLFNLGTLILKVCLILMSQPLFWGYALLAAAMALLWVRLMRSVYRRGLATVELLF